MPPFGSRRLSPLPGLLATPYPAGGSRCSPPAIHLLPLPGQHRISCLHASGTTTLVYPTAFPFRSNGALAGPEGHKIDSSGGNPEKRAPARNGNCCSRSLGKGERRLLKA